MPTIVLALNYWLHLLATAAWLGGLAMLVFIAWPILRPTDDGGDEVGTRILETVERRFRPVANVSLAVLLVTGMLQMGGDPHYEGLFKVSDAWALSLLLKHIVIGGMIVVTVLLQWGVYPALERARLLAQHNQAEGHTIKAAAQRRLQRLAALNVGLGVLVLLLTAFLTAL